MDYNTIKNHKNHFEPQFTGKKNNSDHPSHNHIKNNLKIKICGITTKEDLKVAEDNGADLIGFINVKRSPRYVDLEKIRILSAYLKDKNKGFLVLEPENVDQALEKITKSGLINLQLHSLTPLKIKELKLKLSKEDKKNAPKKKYRIVRAIGISHESLSPKKIHEIKLFTAECSGILFDYQFKGKTGGTGKQIPLKTALEAAQIVKESKPKIEIYLAGGINSFWLQRNGKLIKQFFQFVDFNSSLENFPGKKNHTKMKHAIKTVKNLN